MQKLFLKNPTMHCKSINLSYRSKTCSEKAEKLVRAETEADVEEVTMPTWRESNDFWLV